MSNFNETQNKDCKLRNNQLVPQHGGIRVRARTMTMITHHTRPVGSRVLNPRSAILFPSHCWRLHKSANPSQCRPTTRAHISYWATFDTELHQRTNSSGLTTDLTWLLESCASPLSSIRRYVAARAEMWWGDGGAFRKSKPRKTYYGKNRCTLAKLRALDLQKITTRSETLYCTRSGDRPQPRASCGIAEKEWTQPEPIGRRVWGLCWEAGWRYRSPQSTTSNP